VHAEFWWGNLRERDHFGDLGVDRKMILKLIFSKDSEAWTELIRLRIVTGAGRL